MNFFLKLSSLGRLPVVNFAAGGVATPADAALMMQLGADGVFVGSGIFKSENPAKFARAIVEATTHYQDYKLIAELSKDLGTAMKGIEISITCILNSTHAGTRLVRRYMVKIGVLALQGAVREHIRSVEACGAEGNCH